MDKLYIGLIATAILVATFIFWVFETVKIRKTNKSIESKDKQK
ncbi:MAG: hypothetical protein CEN91_342 [Candidatus Berkelbacteria bacterium Licking1014_85]|uniref:Uncharacterized protein n=1 Tax=Candidatus Berkelbacteria bacterium Licking1014_85 TaxID=2017148 RepID=A0A554LJ87_9BACT|nr:MAG: hypothetical protein CEN91_342 [Candidatus Berkelbacteria bacterium Licking1014_85]